MKKIIFTAVCCSVLVILFFFRHPLKEFAQSLSKPSLPAPKSITEFAKPKAAPSKAVPSQAAPSQNKKSALTEQLTEQINLNIPFASQAPFGNWDLPYKEACEEAAIIMAHYYFTGESFSPQIMKDEILKLVEWQKKTFGYYIDTTAAEMARMLTDVYNHKNVEVRYEFTIDDIKREVAQGYPVILPAAGRLLPNPYFKQPGPIYHALVVKGFTKDKIITNEPGTRRGHDFLYDPDALMNAIHDWNPKNILEGRKAMIVVRR